MKLLIFGVMLIGFACGGPEIESQTTGPTSPAVTLTQTVHQGDTIFYTFNTCTQVLTGTIAGAVAGSSCSVSIVGPPLGNTITSQCIVGDGNTVAISICATTPMPSGFGELFAPQDWTVVVGG